ncbi:unnamed protein product, partial [Chrysoparadoxa australica]
EAVAEAPKQRPKLNKDAHLDWVQLDREDTFELDLQYPYDRAILTALLCSWNYKHSRLTMASTGTRMGLTSTRAKALPFKRRAELIGGVYEPPPEERLLRAKERRIRAAENA